MIIQKGIDVQHTVELGTSAQVKSFKTDFSNAFQLANARDPLNFQIKSISIKRARDNKYVARATVIGEQEAADCFGDPAKVAFARAVALVSPTRDAALADERELRWQALIEGTEIVEEDYAPERLRLIHRTPAQLRELARTDELDMRVLVVGSSIEDVGPTAHKPDPPDNEHLQNGCPSVPCDGDTELDRHKNRRDPGDWIPVTFESILNLKVPDGVAGMGVKRSAWTREQRDAVARYEGTPVQVEGYIIGAKPEHNESCNCCSMTDVDYHVWLVGSEQDLEKPERSIVIEVTPWVRERNPRFTIKAIRALRGTEKQLPPRVRVSGWLMLDQKHLNNVDGSRGTIWEIHPVMAIEVESRGGWQPL